MFYLCLLLNVFPLFVGCSRDWDEDGFNHREDCDDRSPSVNPGAEEICDGIDNDCDGLIDDADSLSESVKNKVYQDADQDGFGSESMVIGYCVNRPTLTGYIEIGLDCDDSDPEINPDGDEVCDSQDNDCDGLIDDEDDSLDLSTGEIFFADSDNDAFGDPDTPIQACLQPEGAASNDDDCNDENSQQRPNLWEDCDDQIDNNCDGFIDGTDSDCVGQNPFNVSMVLWGIHKDGRTGATVELAGDPNGDLWPDALIASPGISNNTGEVALLISTPLLGSDSVYNAQHIFRAKHSFSHTGVDVAGIGDIDDDGFDDLLIGADTTGLHENPLDNENPYGAVYTISGREIISPGIRGLEEAQEILGSDHSQFGHTLSGVGDVDGDGLSDFVVGAPTDGTENIQPKVYLFYGGRNYAVSDDADVSITINPTPEGRLELNNIGDLNNDGRTDVIIGGTDSEAHVYLYWGGLTLRNQRSASDADVKFIPEDGGDQAHQVASGGDLNADGVADLLIGAPYNDSNGRNAGEVYGFFGGYLPESGIVDLNTAPLQLFGGNPGDRAGYVHNAGDLNGDDQKDLLIGAPTFQDSFSNQGKLYGIVVDPQRQYPSPNIEDISTQSITGPKANSRWGRKVAFIGDLDRSSYPDVLLGEPATDVPFSNIGQAKLLSLSESECSDCTEICTDPLDNDGDGLTGCDDPDCLLTLGCGEIPTETCTDGIDNDGDGGLDCIDPDCDRHPECPLTVGVIITGEQTSSRFGYDGVDAGDIDGDGFNEHMWSAPNSSQNGQNNGKVSLFYAETLNTDSSISAQFSDIQFNGENSGDLLGWALASAGDIDQDGLDDILMSAPRSDRNGSNSGAVYLFLGASIQGLTAVPMAQADYIFEGGNENALMGTDIIGNIDINNDGIMDVIFSALDTNEWSQPIAVSHIIQMGDLPSGTYVVDDISKMVYSDPLSTETSLQTVHLAHLGDLDADGLDDFAMGIQGVNFPEIESGGVYITTGHTIMISDEIVEADAFYYGERPGDRAGIVKSAGDIDRDGYMDFLIGMNGNEIKSYIHSGSRFGRGSGGIRSGSYSLNITGEVFQALPDISGDGEWDYLIGDGTNLSLFFGTQFPKTGWLDVDLTKADYIFEDWDTNCSFNSDIDGDGLNDIFLHNKYFSQSRGYVERKYY